MLKSNTSDVSHAPVFPIIRHDGYFASFPQIRVKAGFKLRSM